MKYTELLNEGEGVEEEDTYLAENIFFVPVAARWSVIAENAHTPEIGNASMDSLVKICRALYCDVGDIMEVVLTSEEK